MKKHRSSHPSSKKEIFARVDLHVAGSVYTFLQICRDPEPTGFGMRLLRDIDRVIRFAFGGDIDAMVKWATTVYAEPVTPAQLKKQRERLVKGGQLSFMDMLNRYAPLLAPDTAHLWKYAVDLDERLFWIVTKNCPVNPVTYPLEAAGRVVWTRDDDHVTVVTLPRPVRRVPAPPAAECLATPRWLATVTADPRPAWDATSNINIP